jgi:hypothetical protein
MTTCGRLTITSTVFLLKTSHKTSPRLNLPKQKWFDAAHPIHRSER